MLSPQRMALFVLLATVTEIILVAVSWRLWFGLSDFPAIPVIDTGIEGTASRAFSAGLFLAACLVLAASSFRKWKGEAADWGSSPRALLTCCLALGTACVFLNLHCLQVWHWLFLLICLIRISPQDLQPTLLRTTLASIYIFAAVSRMGFPAAGGMTVQIVQWWCDLAGHHPVPAQKTLLCYAMTGSELACGLFLWIPRTRRLGACLAVLLHAGLLISLSPWGLNHNPPVLVWNCWFLAAIPVAFWKPAADRLTVMRAAAGILALLPGIAGAAGWIDAWPGWQLYSPQPGSAQLFVRSEVIDHLPMSARIHVDPPRFADDLSAVRLGDWSLSSSGAAIYPDPEFQLAVIREIGADLPRDYFRVVVERPRRPKWWKRDILRFGFREDDRNPAAERARKHFQGKDLGGAAADRD